MLKSLFLYTLAAGLVIFSGCKNDKKDKDDENGSGKTEENGFKNSGFQYSPDKPYAYEEGIIKYKFTGSYEGTHIEYFSDNGKVRRIDNDYINKATPTQERVHEVYIFRDDKMIYYDLNTKSGYERPLNDTLTKGNINEDIINLGIDSAMSRHKYKKTDDQVIQGNRCEVYVSQNGESRFCFHEGINIQTVMNYGQQVKYTLEATDIDTKNPKVDDDLFTVPGGIRILTFNQWVKENTKDRL
ncbi:MAG: hypothetical protein M3Q97_07440 [Bacteroidota bacterium]|nr:hypothetical protein [Bacteroidota bacterium]